MKTLKKNSIFLTIKAILGNDIGSFMGGGEGDPAPGADPGSDPAPTGDPLPEWNYPEGFDETLKGHASLKNFANEKGDFNMAGIMKSYIHAQGMMGKDKMGLPDDTWTDDQWNGLYNKLGRPEDIKEYNIENNVGDGIEKNEEFFSALKQSAYDAGLAPKQAQKMADFVNNFLGDSLKSNTEQSEAAYQKEADALQRDWGDKHDYKLNRAFSALQEFASPEEIAEMRNKGLMDNTVVVRLFDKIADGMAEDSLKVKGTQTFGMTGEEAAREIDSYYKPGHPFMVRGHAEHKYYKDKMLKLQNIKLAARKR